MTYSMSHASIPTFEVALNALSAILDKGEAFAVAKKIDPSVLLATRLAPDMFALTRQVQIACDLCKNGMARLAGVEPPKLENKETTYSELKERVAKTITFLNGLKPEQFEGSDDKDITMGERTMPGRAFLMTQTYPQFYFHCTTAYDILRHCGVPLVKSDFIGKHAAI